MADERTMPKEVPASDRDAHREIADRAGKNDPAIQIEKEKAEKDEKGKSTDKGATARP